MQNFRNLEVWQKGHDLTLRIYRATAAFPRSETYGLTSQTRRAAASIPANIAEGCARATNSQFRQFLHIAAGSANELIYLLPLSKDLGFLAPSHAEVLESQGRDAKQMLTRLIQRIDAGVRQPKRSLAPARVGPSQAGRA